MMKHAYLIIAHSGWEQLQLLLQLLDAENCDIYVHIDKKAIAVPWERLKDSVKKSKIHFYQDYKVYWGSFELVQVELLLFEKAHEHHYDYYHLLSGADLPIKSQRYINNFFEKNAGYEFVHFDTDDRLESDKEIGRRTRLYHFLQNYRRRYKNQFLNSFFTFIERILLVIQLVLRVDRMKRHREFSVRYGSQWVSITDDLVKHILDNQKKIYDIFCYTNCADELFIQSLVYNSQFRSRLFNQKFDDSVLSNMRLIDMKQRGCYGNPYTWKKEDWDEIKDSECLFARKFSVVEDEEIVQMVCNYVKPEIEGENNYG